MKTGFYLFHADDCVWYNGTGDWSENILDSYAFKSEEAARTAAAFRYVPDARIVRIEVLER